MRRNSDERLRDAKRRAETSDAAADVLTYVVELERAGMLEEGLDMLPSLQVKVMDALARQTDSGRREDVLRYMKVLSLLGYPSALRHEDIHSSELEAGVAVALVRRGFDPQAVFHVIRGMNLWEEAIGPMLDELDPACEAVEEEIEAQRRARRGLLSRRRRAANEAYANRRRTDADYWSNTNTDRQSPWRADGDALRRVIEVSDQDWSDEIDVTVMFEPGSDVVTSVTTVSRETGQDVSEGYGL